MSVFREAWELNRPHSAAETSKRLPFNSPPRSSSAQSSRSCDSCFISKIKCDQGRPCSSCIRRGRTCESDGPNRQPIFATEHLHASPISEGSSPISQAPSEPARSRYGARFVTKAQLGSGFTKSQLSIALMIQKSKPGNLSAAEYCRELRKHVRNTKSRVTEEYRYINSVEFWKGQVTRLHTEKQNLEGEIAQLRLLVDRSSSPDLSSLYVEVMRSLSKKIPLKSDALAPEDVDLDEPTIEQPDSISEDFEPVSCLPFLVRLQAFQRLLYNSKIPPNTLASSLSSLLSCATTMLNEICDTIMGNTLVWVQLVLENTTQCFNMVVAGYNLCLKGLKHLCRDIAGRQIKGQIIYALVDHYMTILDHIHKLCEDQVRCRPEMRKTSENNMNMLRNPQKSTTILAILTNFSNLLSNILLVDEFDSPSIYSAEVLEGLLSCLLTRTGHIMGQVIFKDSSEGVSPDEIAHNHENGIRPETEHIEGLVALLEGKTLGAALKSILSRISQKSPEVLRNLLTRAPVLEGNWGRDILLIRIRSRLQKTLMRGIFGEDESQFFGALKVPSRPEGEAVFEMGDADVDQVDPFINTMWSILGWDLLPS